MQGLSCIVTLTLIPSWSCITSSWKTDNIGVQHFDKTLVSGLMGSEGSSIREQTGEKMVESLKERRGDAVAASVEYKPKAFENLSEEEAMQKTFNRGSIAKLADDFRQGWHQ